MNTTVKEIFNHWHPLGILTSLQGPDNRITNIAPAESCGSGDLVFVDKVIFVDVVLAGNPSCVVTTEKLASHFSEVDNLSVFIAPNVGVAQAKLRQKYTDRNLHGSTSGSIHPSAIIHETATIGKGTTIGPLVVIEAHVTTGTDCVVMAGSVIENNAILGDNTIIYPNVTIGYECELGNEVMVHSGSVVGSEGYGFAQDENKRSHRIPQTGKVVIEDRVRVGACNCIDRAAFAETRIGAGTKIDNMCHIGHNVKVGQDCLFIAGLTIGGSTTLGDRVITSGSTAIIDHLNISSDVAFIHRAGVTKDIPKPGIYAGLPLLPMADYAKNIAAFKTLNEMRQQLRTLKQKVKDLETK